VEVNLKSVQVGWPTSMRVIWHSGRITKLSPRAVITQMLSARG